MTEGEGRKRNVDEGQVTYSQARPQHNHDGKRRRKSLSTNLEQDLREIGTQNSTEYEVLQSSHNSLTSSHTSLSPLQQLAVPKDSTVLPVPLALHSGVYHMRPPHKHPMELQKDKIETTKVKCESDNDGKVASREVNYGSSEGPRKRYLLHCPAIEKPLNGIQTKQEHFFTLKKVHQKITLAIQRQIRRPAPRTLRAGIETNQTKIVHPRNSQSCSAQQSASVPQRLSSWTQLKPGQIRIGAPRGSSIRQGLQQFDTKRIPTAFTPPPVPRIGIYNMMNNYDARNPNSYLDFLRSLGTSDRDVNSEGTPHLPEPHTREMDGWLLSLLHPDEPRLLFHDLTTPGKDDLTLLARCIRFAQSRNQQDLSWVVHPVHVALIVERTNPHGYVPAPHSDKTLGPVTMENPLWRFWTS